MKLNTYYAFKRFCELTGNKYYIGKDDLNRLKTRRSKELNETTINKETIKELLDSEFTSNTLVTDYHEAMKVSALKLDYAGCYGGYAITQYNPDNTGINHPYGYNRSKESVLVDMLHFHNNVCFYNMRSK